MNILVATNNEDKLAEIQEITKNYKHSFFSLKEWCLKNKKAIPEVEETGTTFYENALLKAQQIYSISKEPVLADDTGLVVPALNGKPGIFSARYAIDSDELKALNKKEKYRLNNEKLLKDLAGATDRGAYFICEMVLFLSENNIFRGTGKCFGEIISSPKGAYGFGYDSIFLVKSKGKTFAELEAGEKNKISHRAHALHNLFENFTH